MIDPPLFWGLYVLECCLLPPSGRAGAPLPCILNCCFCSSSLQRLKDEIAEVTNEIENLGSTEERWVVLLLERWGGELFVYFVKERMKPGSWWSLSSGTEMIYAINWIFRVRFSCRVWNISFQDQCVNFSANVLIPCCVWIHALKEMNFHLKPDWRLFHAIT